MNVSPKLMGKMLCCPMASEMNHIQIMRHQINARSCQVTSMLMFIILIFYHISFIFYDSTFSPALSYIALRFSRE